MKRFFLCAAALMLLVSAGCGAASDPYTAPAAQQAETTREVTDTLPVRIASAQDLTGEGGYLLLATLPEWDIALYCDNAPQRARVYIRYGHHFQALEQAVWQDPTVLPAMSCTQAEDGALELTVQYLRHEGTYFDGTKASSGLVAEVVVYRWDGRHWKDLHFHSSGPNEAIPVK